MNSTRTPSTAHRLVRRIGIGLVFAVMALLVLGTAAASLVSASPARTGAVVTDVDRAVVDLVGDHPGDALSHLPAGFESTMGYRPVLEDSRPVNPHGSCSSPIPLPDRFESLCRAHDFGYDLLRFGQRTGRTVPPWARRALDGMLIDAMHDSCTNPLCDAAATLADAGLETNSWRQDWHPPTAESTGDIVSTTATRLVETIGARR